MGGPGFGDSKIAISGDKISAVFRDEKAIHLLEAHVMYIYLNATIPFQEATKSM